MRGMFFVYMISNGAFKTIQPISIFFMDQSWNQEGLGVGTKQVFLLSLISCFPIAIILMGSPSVVPKHIGYKSFIRIMCLALTACVVLIPLWRDVFSRQFLVKHVWIVYLNIILLYCFNPQVFSPFINFVLNDKVPPEDRTSINSITLIGSTLCSSLFVNLMGPLYSFSFSGNFFLQYYPYNKYFCFVLLGLILVIGQAFMKEINLSKKI